MPVSDRFSGPVSGRFSQGPPGPFFLGLGGPKFGVAGGPGPRGGRAKTGWPGPPLPAQNAISPSRRGVHGVLKQSWKVYFHSRKNWPGFPICDSFGRCTEIQETGKWGGQGGLD